MYGYELWLKIKDSLPAGPPLGQEQKRIGGKESGVSISRPRLGLSFT